MSGVRIPLPPKPVGREAIIYNGRAALLDRWESIPLPPKVRHFEFVGQARRLPFRSASDALALQNSNTTNKKAGQHQPSGFQIMSQRLLNCALSVVSSLSLDFFRYRGLNDMSEIPKDLRVSRRPIQSLLRASSQGDVNSP